MREKKRWSREQIGKLIVAVALLLTPVVMLCFRSLQIGMNCFKFHAVWSDEMVYWREVYNFLHTGLRSGYTGADDLAPEVANFGTHSFINTLLYTAFALLGGWHDNSILIYNLLFLILCLSIFLWQVRPDWKKGLLLVGSLLFYLPLYYYLPTLMTEVINYGGILLYTAALLKTRGSKRSDTFVWMFVWTIFLTLYKLPNAVFFIPLVLMAFEGRVTKRFCLHTLFSVVVCGIVYRVNTAFTAPYPWFFSDVFEQETVGKMIGKVWGRFTENLGHFVSLQYGTVQERTQRYFYLLLLVLFCILAGKEIWHFWKMGRESERKLDMLGISYALMLLASFLLVNGFYEVWDWRDYRMMAPIAWSGVLVLILAFPVSYVALPLGCSVVLFAGELLHPNEVFINWERTQAIETPAIADYIAYDSEAKDRFDNTLAVESIDLGIYCRLEAGIGIQNIFTPEKIVHSKYVLVQDFAYDFPGYELLCEGDFGRLYVRKVD